MSYLRQLFSLTLLLGLGLICRLTAESEGEMNAEELKVHVVSRPDICDEKSKDGDYLIIRYAGYYPETNVDFDNRLEGDPLIFQLGKNEVMPAWEKGLQKMCQGEKRDILISPGDLQKVEKNTAGAILPEEGKTIAYHFELVAIRDTRPQINLFKKMDLDLNDKITKEEMKVFFAIQGLGGMKDDESLDEAVANIMQFQDKNNDDVISHEEFIGPKHDEL